jgi:ectoine hydroxylase-related dioxygenase (phytanoyl-CoA dioxygenase family)
MGEPGSTLTRHPLNTAFEWVSPQPPYRRLTPHQAEQFDRDGYVVIDDLIDAATLEAVTAEIDRYEAKVDAFLKTQPDERMMIAESGALTVTIHIAHRSPILTGLVTSPALTDLCADLIGPDVNLYWDQAVYKKPEKPRRVPWHQDNGYTYIEPQQYLTIWLALTDATLDNGCPHVAPGLHKLGTLEHYYVEPLGFECFDAPEQQAAAPVKAGGAVVFSSLMPHLTGPNTTGPVRKAYIVQYAPVGAYTRTKDGDVPCDDPVRQFPVLRNGERV